MDNLVTGWGLDMGSFDWMPTTLKIDLAAETLLTFDGTEYKPVPTKTHLERLSKAGWLLLLSHYKPMQTGNLEDCTGYLVESIKAIATIYPGIILYGAERFPNSEITFQDNFWETVGTIDDKLTRAEINLELLKARSAQLQETRIASKAIPSRVKTLADSNRGKPVSSINPKVKAALKPYYVLSGEIFEAELIC